MACLGIAALLAGEGAALGTAGALGSELGLGVTTLAGEAALGTALGGAGYLGAGAGAGTFAAGGLGVGAGLLDVAAEAGAFGAETFAGGSDLMSFGNAADNAGGIGGAMGDGATQYLGQMGQYNPLAGGAVSNSFGLPEIKSALQWASPLSSVFSGIQGIQQAGQLKKAGQQASRTANPWGAGGGQALADSQLQQLMTNPGQVAAQDPSYALRLQGAQRATAQQGQNSGAMAVAGANATSNWYDQRMAALGGLAGAPGNPGGAAQLGLQGQIASGDMLSKGLGSIAYGTNSMPGMNNAMASMPPQLQQGLQQWMKQQGIAGA